MEPIWLLIVLMEKEKMRFVACNIRESHYRKWGGIRELLTEIINSKEACVEIKEFPHQDAYSCARSMKACIKRDRLTQLKICVRCGRVFVINTLFVKD